jgi:hypothetical protein
MSLDAYYHAPMSLAPFITKLEISATTMSKGTETALKHYPVPRKWPSHNNTTTLEMSEMGLSWLYILSSPPRSAAVAAFAANRGPWHPSEGNQRLPKRKSRRQKKRTHHPQVQKSTPLPLYLEAC